MKKLKNNKTTSYEEDITNLSKKEKELLSSYDEDANIEIYEEEEPKTKKTKTKKKEKVKEPEKDLELEEYEFSDEEYNYDEDEDTEEFAIDDEPVEEKKVKKVKDEKIVKANKKANKILNICLFVVLVIIAMITIDIVSVSKYNRGPYFALPLTVYDDGGTKAYYGIGYKVIKYNQLQGRRDMVIGSWGLRYNAEPIYVDVVDLAIEFNDNESAAYKKYYKKFMRITGTLTNVSEKQNTITLSYVDAEGSKYSLDVVCKMATDKDSLRYFSTDEEVTVIGTITEYTYKTMTDAGIVHVSNCFAAQ